MKFSEVIGHSGLKGLLRNTIDTNRISHAQMFIASAGVGALPMALAYVQYLFCKNHMPATLNPTTLNPATLNLDSCGVCAECYKIQKLEHPDVHWVFPVNSSKEARAVGSGESKPVSDQFVHLWREIFLEHNGYITEAQWYEKIGIDNKQGLINKEQANDIVAKMSLKSMEGGYKVVVVWLPERMNDQAANTLLKLIEEPAPKTLFIFVTEQVDKIIATIRSRAVEIRFNPIEAQDIEWAFTQRNLASPSSAVNISRLAMGSWQRAVDIAQNEGDDTYFDFFKELMRLAFSNKYLELFDWAERIATIGRESQKRFIIESVGLLRECYVLSIGMPEISYLHTSREAFAQKFAPFVNHKTVDKLVEEFERLQREIAQNGNAKILFTHFALTVSKIIR